jgi:hypothetical protein
MLVWFLANKAEYIVYVKFKQSWLFIEINLQDKWVRFIKSMMSDMHLWFVNIKM